MYSFYEVSDVSLFTSTLTILTILIGCIIFVTYTFSKGYRIKELPVNWIHKKGSKISVFKDSLKMFISLLKMKFIFPK